MLNLIRRYPQILIFGILATMFSGAGQTFLVSLFIPPMREHFEMTRTEIAGWYSGATLLSAFLLPLMGRFLDRVRLVSFVLTAGVLLALGCFILSQSRNTAMIFIGFLLIRNLGQGTLTIASSTTMARVFGAMRGKALSISNLGYPLGEAMFPLILSSCILSFGWRSGWLVLGFLTLLLFSPAAYFLLRKDPHERARSVFARRSNLEKEALRTLHEVTDWTVRDMVRDWRFYALLTPVLIPPLYLTALFFHQANLAAWKGWDIRVVSAAFIAFAVTRGLVSFFSGALVDRYSATRLFPLTIVPLGLGILAVLFGEAPFWAFVYLGGAGVTMGLGMTTKGALWAELYGTKELGAIRGVISALIVFSTAVAPVLMGFSLDAGVPPGVILWGMLAVMAVGVLLAAWVAVAAKR